MRRYTNKELAAMSPEEGEELMKMIAEENERLGEQIRAIMGKEKPKKEDKKDSPTQK